MIFRAFNFTLGSDFFTRGMSKPTRSWQVFCPFQVESIQIKLSIHYLLTSSFRIKPGVGVSSEEVPFVTRFLSLIVFFVAIILGSVVGISRNSGKKECSLTTCCKPSNHFKIHHFSSYLKQSDLFSISQACRFSWRIIGG